MEPLDLEKFESSFDRCIAQGEFLQHFYRNVTKNNPTVAEKFRDSDMTKQVRMLKLSIYFIMLASDDQLDSNSHLDQIAEKHSKSGYDVHPALYDIWLNELLSSVKEFDPLYSEEIDLIWRRVMNTGIEYMKRRYE